MANNQEMLEKWNGDAGRRWADYQGRIDAALDIFGVRALAKFQARPGERVIDVGCGAGATVLSLAKAVGGGGQVLGLDASETLLNRARERTAGLEQVSFVHGDASQHPLPGDFDGVFSRFGVMFFDQPSSALAHLRGALHPRGRMVFVCWQGLEANPWIAEPLKAVLPFLAEPPAAPIPNAPGPFGFADPDHLRSLVLEAGFTDIEIEEVMEPVTVGQEGVDDAVEFAMQVGPCERIASEQTEAVQEKMRVSLKQLYSECERQDASVTLSGAAWILSAKNAD
ncbi:MAG: SAM-dependent methyltransferase [Planctomycetota bacterium]|jgi:SAM-dependent methyltransferase